MGAITLLRTLLGDENTGIERFWFERGVLVVRVRPKAAERLATRASQTVKVLPSTFIRRCDVTSCWRGI